MTYTRGFTVLSLPFHQLINVFIISIVLICSCVQELMLKFWVALNDSEEVFKLSLQIKIPQKGRQKPTYFMYSILSHKIGCLNHWIALKFDRPQGNSAEEEPVNSLRPSDVYMRQYKIVTLLQIMACLLFCTKPLSEPMVSYFQLDPKEHISVNFYWKIQKFSFKEMHLKMSSANVLAILPDLNVLYFKVDLQILVHISRLWDFAVLKDTLSFGSVRSLGQYGLNISFLPIN